MITCWAEEDWYVRNGAVRRCDMSAWMLMGVPGAMFATGLSTLWLALGLTIGAYSNYLLLAPRLRAYTEVADDAITIPDFSINGSATRHHC